MFCTSQSVVFLGFLIDSVTMTVRLTPDKAHSIKECCDMILNENVVTIKQIAQLVGMFVASEPGVEYARLYYKTLEVEKDSALKTHKGNFEGHLTISHQSRTHLEWWSQNVCLSLKLLSRNLPDLVLKSDSSKFG